MSTSLVTLHFQRWSPWNPHVRSARANLSRQNGRRNVEEIEEVRSIKLTQARLSENPLLVLTYRTILGRDENGNTNGDGDCKSDGSVRPPFLRIGPPSTAWRPYLLRILESSFRSHFDYSQKSCREEDKGSLVQGTDGTVKVPSCGLKTMN